MKMIIVIVKDNESEALTRALTSAEYRVTTIASTGGFLRSGVVTLLIGVDEARVDKAITLIRETVTASKSEEKEKQATLFVVPVSRFEQI